MRTRAVSYTHLDVYKRQTKGYPFFIQQLCKIVYQNTDEDLIEESDVENCIDEFLKTLDEGFFRAR